ncbi:MAG: hypothetical protein BZ135_02080 [Methanosphaera sp. rholeuAM6]|nr:MAG: hypothetical protein BZ135_02080 [Methanosphaera sp. rholeuAM6]
MSNNAQEEFISNAKKEIKQKIKSETKVLEKLKKEKGELTNAIEGYDIYYHNLERFIIQSMQEFTQNEEDLPKYFKSHINGTYQEYVQIRQEGIKEMESLKKYINHCKREAKTNERTLKFYRSQYMDSDFFDECLPLVDLYQQKIELYNGNIELTVKTIEKLEKIVKKLEKWQ